MIAKYIFVIARELKIGIKKAKFKHNYYEIVIQAKGSGVFIAVVGKIWLIAQAANIAQALVVSTVCRQGIDVDFGWYWFLPVIDFTARR